MTPEFIVIRTIQALKATARFNGNCRNVLVLNHLVQGRTSVFTICFSLLIWVFTLLARSSYTCCCEAVGCASACDTAASSAANLLFNLTGKLSGSSLARFLVWYRLSSTVVSSAERLFARSRTAFDFSFWLSVFSRFVSSSI